MKRSRLWLGVGIVVAMLLCGCGGSGSAGPGDKAAPSHVAGADTPAAAVGSFLNAVLKGDDAGARNLLSELAREKTAKMELVKDLHVSSQANFKLGDVEMIGQDGAHVASVWKDVDEDGQSYESTIVWIAAKEEEGWRIVGMAIKVFDDQPAVVFNYEDTDDMKRKQLLIEEEMVRRDTEETTRQAQQQPPANDNKKSR